MKHKQILLLTLTLALGGFALLAVAADEPAAVDNAAKDDAGFANESDKVSYIIGLNLGQRFRADDIDVNVDVLVEGIKTGLADAEPRLTQEQIQAVMSSFQEQLRDQQMKKMQQAAVDNAAKGKAFLEENAKKEGVITTASGLQYKVIKEGDGKTPTATDTFVAHYKGTLIDGTVFDSSYDRNEPLSMQVNRVIPGWQEALKLMKVGAKWQLFIPASLAYGENSPPGSPIGPNSVLIFDIELLDVK